MGKTGQKNFDPNIFLIYKNKILVFFKLNLN